MNRVLVVHNKAFYKGFAAVAMFVAALAMTGPRAGAQDVAFKQALAQAAAGDRALAEFYRTRGYEPLWTSGGDGARRRALLQALDGADDHGLPAARYDAAALEQLFRSARTPNDLGRVEAEASRIFLQYAQDIQTGVLNPGQLDDEIKRVPPRRDRLSQLDAFAKSSPRAYMNYLIPGSGEYNRLLVEKQRYERILGAGGWGETVPDTKLQPGDSGPAVVMLRNRLIAMGYMGRSSQQVYDATLQRAVQAFQQDHGLAPDGVAGAGTIAEINQPPELRLQSIIVAMERERWLGPDRGKRHVLVNIPDYHARIVENGKTVFETRAVVGSNRKDQRTPEFSDTMDHMILNPTWNVPRSIVVKEYLPLLKKNPNAAGQLRMIDASGRVVDRNAVDFSAYTENTFPYGLKEPPSDGNALGLVKFMFPNPYNIYLHDTPAKSLFGRETRAFSHGCIRLADPFDFAYALLSAQVRDPQGFFQATLAGGKETRVDLVRPLPVHLIYRTAFTQAKGHIQFRRDIYGRDAEIFAALAKAGVVLRAIRG